MEIRKKISLVLCGTMCAMLLGACGQTEAVVTESASTSPVEMAETSTIQEETTISPDETASVVQTIDTKMAAGEIGKVTAVDGDKITLVMANTPDGQNAPADAEAPTDMEKPADGEAPTDMEKPADAEAPTDMEKPADGEAPTDMEKPAVGEAPTDIEKSAGGGNAEMQFNGEEQTITVTETTVITKDGDTTASTIDDITVDSIIRIVTDATSKEVTQIVIINAQN